MEKDRNNMLDEKVDLMKTCIKLVENAEEVIQCPVCFEISEQTEQCVTGHLICQKCRRNIDNSCPICKGKYLGTKSFIIPELSKTFSNLKISLDKLDNKFEKPNKVEDYRDLIKTVLTRMSIFLNSTNGTFQILTQHLQHPTYITQNEMEKQLVSLTTQLHRLKYFMDDTKETLVALKK